MVRVCTILVSGIYMRLINAWLLILMLSLVYGLILAFLLLMLFSFIFFFRLSFLNFLNGPVVRAGNIYFYQWSQLCCKCATRHVLICKDFSFQFQILFNMEEEWWLNYDFKITTIYYSIVCLRFIYSQSKWYIYR